MLRSASLCIFITTRCPAEKGRFKRYQCTHLLPTVDNLKISEVPYTANETEDGTWHSLYPDHNLLHLIVPFILQVTIDVSEVYNFLNKKSGHAHNRPQGPMGFRVG
jgi:hypothetical protein